MAFYLQVKHHRASDTDARPHGTPPIVGARWQMLREIVCEQ